MTTATKPTARQILGPGAPDWEVCDICWHVISPTHKGGCRVCTMEDTVHDPPYPKYSTMRRKAFHTGGIVKGDVPAMLDESLCLPKCLMWMSSNVKVPVLTLRGILLEEHQALAMNYIKEQEDNHSD